MTAALMVAALLLDSLTYLAVGEYEANPIVTLLGPALALAIRWAAIVVLLLTARHIAHRRSVFLVIGAWGAFGAASNVRSLANITGFSSI